MNNSSIKTNKIINGESVSYSLFFAISLFFFVALKQLLKVFIGINAGASIITSFVISEVLLYLFEKRFVFKKSVLSSNIKQILMLIFRASVNLGLFKLSELLFGNALSMKKSMIWLMTACICFFFNYYFDRILTFDCAYDAVEINNSKIYISFFRHRFVVLSAVLAGVALLIIFMAYQVFPFGDNTVMRMDLYHQYGPLFAELYTRVVNHQSLLYSWTSGGGSSFLGNYLNYLSSPLTALIFLFDKADISFAITFLVFIKCILSASSFSFYLQKSQNKASYISSCFGVFYAFSAYFLAYYWNVMWLDGMILLPLIALGIESIINNGSAKIYVISLSLLFLSNYYMGFMSCIFAVIYFIAYYVISSKFNEKINSNLVFEKHYSFKALMNNKIFNRAVKFGIWSIAAAGICAITLVPTFIILRTSSATSGSFPTTFESYFNIFDFITSHLAGLETTIRSSGDDVLPNVYSGMLACLLVPLFVINKDIRFKEKATYIILLLFFLFSFDNNCLNYIWHAFHFPNDLPFRFSYMYSFILLTIGFKAITKLKSVGLNDIIFVGLGWVFFICTAQKLSTTKMSELTIYISLAFIIIWSGFLYLKRKNTLDKFVLSALAVVICFCEVVIADTKPILITQNNEDYKKNYSTYTEAFGKIHDTDDDFYREELCYLETRMDPSYYGYNGMSVFSSMAYEDFSQLQYSLGMFGNRINSYTYFPQTPVYNMMFGVKYLVYSDIGLEPNNRIYEYKFSTQDEIAKVYENKYYLPVAYCTDTDLEKWNTEEGNPFEVQSDYFERATGYKDVFNEVKYLNTEFDNVFGDYVTNNGTYWFNKDSADSTYGYVDITITPENDGNVYLYITSPDIKSIEVNSEDIISHTQPIEEPYILDLGYYKTGDEIVIQIDCGSSETSETYADIYAYSLNENVFISGYEKLKEQSINVTEHDDTSIVGTISVKENSYLYSSIPFDKGWSVYIDGEKAETFKIGTSLLGTTIKPGEHTVEYKYSPLGIKIGFAISVLTLLSISAYWAYNHQRKKEEYVDLMSYNDTTY